MKEVKQFIIIREDLGMSIGKAGAQAAHAASNIFFDKFEQTKIIRKSGEEPVDAFVYFPTAAEMQWIKNGMRTKIVKKVKNEEQLLKVFEKAKEARLNVALIKDMGLTELEGENFTAIAIGPNYVDDCEPIVKRLRNL